MQQVQYLRPDEILSEMRQSLIAYLPLGLLEWHGPHLPMGVDAINAESVALLAADISGGLVFPTVYFGTERERSPEVLNWLGFQPDEYVVGMDFNENNLKSHYVPESYFALIVRENLRNIIRMGFKVVVMITGHAAANQIETLERLAIEFSAISDCDVILELPFNKNTDGIYEVGHASKVETSIMLALMPERVKLENLPSMDIPIKNTEYAIIDYQTFLGQPTDDHSVRKSDDPRYAQASIGEETIEKASRRIAAIAADILEKLENV
jgi:creatinine amidohydrolase